MKSRIVKPEILDHLDADDPAAIRSRTDLRRINAVMGNYRWVAKAVKRRSDRIRHWVELGAGDGQLSTHLRNRESGVTGLDFAPRPDCWPSLWNWESGDLFETLPKIADKHESLGVIANLFLHHFSEAQLRSLGELLSKSASVLIFSEPARHWFHRVQACLAHPLINHVTKHDMHVSIEAGFRGQELAQSMDLSRNFEAVETSHNFFGSYRLIAEKPKS